MSEQDARRQAEAKLKNIKVLVEALSGGEEPLKRVWEEYGVEANSADDVVEIIQEMPLEVSVQSGWCGPEEPLEPREFLILLCTGGPAVRIRGTLNEYKEPDDAMLEYQDWFTPWSTLDLTEADRNALLRFSQVFYFGG